MGEITPLRRRIIEGMTGPQSLSGNPTILYQRCAEVQPLLRLITRSA
ncbi:hypothetical protein SJ05684_b49710 (plasmid) [Sinorhizobium sojae CCBAU 05684]|uniref:Uncharacterized protein n=1 Tax=Sinorhizobium sojae CCBAU 05684 TaxID=716928 RepID=A0A249PJ38_9HYPH|nr:hypothetical protein SJ05684_b49710 [Sinorhizobium sojae CCBAU 05684]